ncbi:MAG: hypothetical protein VX322_00750, partial [Actinomycetota bacterium]|nr:hypothetical protein [Actinomycetota bacterium]
MDAPESFNLISIITVNVTPAVYVQNKEILIVVFLVAVGVTRARGIATSPKTAPEPKAPPP